MVKRLTREIFIDKASVTHNHKYGYDYVTYVNNKTKVEIICPHHGAFLQTPNDHLLGHGCPTCKAHKVASLQIKSLDIFVQEAKLIHSDIYDYSLVNYLGRNKKITIICHKHGKFEQSPQIHLRGHGCPRCVGSISKLEIRWLDTLNIPTECRNIFVNVGNKKVRVDALYNNMVYEFYGDYWHGNPNIYDGNKINAHNNKTFNDLYFKTLERESLIKQAGYKFVSIWESDYRNSL